MTGANFGHQIYHDGRVTLSVNFHCAIVLMMVKMTQMKKQMKMAVVMIK
jgi:hypothetical protein